MAETSEEGPTVAEVAVGELVKIRESFRKLERTGFSQKYIIALIHDDTKLPKGKIIAVLDSITRITSDFLKTAK